MPEVIADRFELERLVGSGGMGDVYRARDRLTGGACAVKLMHAAAAKDAERFRREAQMLAEISHPRIVRYVAHGASGNRPYIAMEWLEGEDLSDRLGREGLTLHESLTVARGVAEALALLHDRGIVHRDIKPSNVFLSGKRVDQVKVLDLGVARFLNASRPSTRSGVMVGTPGYMAPEQARGSKEIDARADVFSLGCVVFECLAGRPAFAGDNIAALLAKILLETPPSLHDQGIDVPKALDDLVARMLSKHVPARPANASIVLRELDPFRRVPDSPPQRASAPLQRALTGSERRLVSVVMATFRTDPDLEPPPPSAHVRTTAVASFDPRAVVASFGADAEMLADGSIVVTLVGKGGAGDQAAHAARCALALRSHMMSADLALATGFATVTGSSVVGEVIERAAELLASAKTRKAGASEETIHGQSPVFLDETTAGLLDMRFDVGGDERGLFIRGLREREAKPRTLLGKPTPFVGRDRELATLVGIFEECVAEPVARAVLVTGQPGAGKSRIVSELLGRIREEGTAEIWLGRGDPMSEGSPFSLLARVIRRAAAIGGGEPLVVRQQKMRARVARNIGEADVARVTEFVGELASVQFPEAQSVQLRAARQDAILMGDQMRRAFCDLVLAETKSGPLVVVLEDLHWGDLPTVSFVDSALRAASERPLMVLAVARTEVHELFPSLWEQRSVQEIRLGPLVRRAGERLVRDVLGAGVGDDEMARLLDRAAGNVFYLEELIRAYAEGTQSAQSATGRSRMSSPPGVHPTPREMPSVLPPASRRPEPTGPLEKAGAARDAWSLPGTVLAMVEARLERLDPMARRVLRAASIFGELFWRGGVLALTGGDYEAAQIDDWLSDLAHREIVQRRDVSRFPQERELGFRHALVRDAAYQMLTPEDRALGHRLAGEWLEKLGEHEPIILAEHFERGGAVDKAIAYWIRAATQALEGNDFGAARARAERAVAAGAAGATLGRVQLLLAEACRWAGDHQEAMTQARAALDMLPRGSDPWCFAVAEAVDAATTMGRAIDTKTIAWGEEQVAASATSLTTARCIATSRIVVRLISAGAFESADRMLDRTEREGKELIAREPGARAFVLAARVARSKWLGDPEDAANYAREAVACFETVGDVRNAAAQLDNAGFAVLQVGAFAVAQDLLERSIASADRLGLPGVANEARCHLGQLFARTSRKDDAVRVIAEVIAAFQIQRDAVGEGRARAYLAGALHLAGDFAAADEEAKRAYPLMPPTYRAPVLGLMAVTRADRGDVDGAYEAGCEAMRLLQEIGGTIEAESLVRIGHAEALRAKGDVEGSKRAITIARDRLLARAAKIKNPEWRRGFVERLQENTRILARAGEWLA